MKVETLESGKTKYTQSPICLDIDTPTSDPTYINENIQSMIQHRLEEQAKADTNPDNYEDSN